MASRNVTQRVESLRNSMNETGDYLRMHVNRTWTEQKRDKKS